MWTKKDKLIITYFRKKIAVLTRLSNFASCMDASYITQILFFTDSKALSRNKLPGFFRGYIEIPILIIIVVQTLCNNVWSRYNMCDCYFMMTGIQSFLRDTWHSYATVMRVFIMCMIGGWEDERKLCLMSLYVPIPQRECQYILRWHTEDE